MWLWQAESLPYIAPLNGAGMTLLSSLLFTLRQSGDPGHNNNRDCRPMTLRHQVSLILPFGQPVSLDQHFVLILDA